MTEQPYSKVARSTWGDHKFKSLSDRSKFLWLFLLTGPHCTSIPGVLPNVGIGTIADALAWPASRVRKHFAEIDAAGMAIADWSANVIVLPNAVLYNEPANFNVITSWRRIPLPQCDLVVRALRAIRVMLFSKEDPTPWVSAFDEAFAKQFPNGLLKPLLEPSAEPLPEPRAGATKQDPDPGSGSETGSIPSASTGGVEPVESADTRPVFVRADRRHAIAISEQDRTDAVAFRQYHDCPHTPPCRSIHACLDVLASSIAVRRYQTRKYAN